ncbi:ribonuclease Z [Candidatus Bathyarchaeota archaeon]|nr:ribonuclease Z [Candidatus Bathyarchaeota archaeon]
MSAGIDVIFLGTGGSLPTKERGLPCVALRRDGELIILDCGEGTQRQMMHAGLGFNRPTTILISHLHGDHILGLPGLLQTMSSLARDKPLDLYGPKDLTKFLDLIYKPLGYPANFKIRAQELGPGEEVDRGEYVIKTALAKHDVLCLAYGIVEKERAGRFHPERAKRLGIPEGPLWGELQHGKSVKVEARTIRPDEVVDSPRRGLKVVYAIDTRPADPVKSLAKDADLLIHDGGFTEDRRPKAQEYYHSTASEASQLAKSAKAKRLALVHISAVTRDDSVLLREARKAFRNTIVPKDFQVVSLKLAK